MRPSDRERRLAALEDQAIARLPPGERALARLARGEPASALTDAELTAFVDGPDAQYLTAIPDELLDLLIARPESEPWLVQLQEAYAVGWETFDAVLAQTRQALQGGADALAN